jgi:hypothetical protein
MSDVENCHITMTAIFNVIKRMMSLTQRLKLARVLDLDHFYGWLIMYRKVGGHLAYRLHTLK